MKKMSMDFAYDTFVDLREKQLQKNQESYNKIYVCATVEKLRQQIILALKNIKKNPVF